MMTKSMLNLTFIFIGAIFQGVAMSVFLFPHNIPSGGAAGLAIILNHWFHLPLGFSLWLVNFAFLILALQYFGYTWTIRTMLSVTITSVTVSMITSSMGNYHHNLIADILIGSILFGVGVGLLIRNGASSGGMVIPALMIANSYNWSPGKIMMWINLLIFILTATVIDLKIVIFAIICQSISTNIIDFIYHMRVPSFFSPNYSWRKK
ncbi:YitT family protein [Litchfieldia alkalitelluris]|uniref:YitT family protein n=1 Tax=Litchfieldia alkalitelluris TaxID=304268 RepID=UPI002E25F01B